MTDAAYLSPPLEIEERFLDYNGHVNMAYHLVLADQALDLAFATIKGDDYVDGRRMTTFAAELHVLYLSEMHVDDEIRGRVRWIASDEKRVLWTVELVRGRDRDVVTTVEGVSLSVDLGARRVSPFPADVVKRLEAAVGRDASAADGLAWLGGKVGMRRR